jgi:hypothetical protein
MEYWLNQKHSNTKSGNLESKKNISLARPANSGTGVTELREFGHRPA